MIFLVNLKVDKIEDDKKDTSYDDLVKCVVIGYLHFEIIVV